MKFPKIILSSKSPRRSQLLAEAGFDFEVRTVTVEETYPPDLDPRKVPEFLARKKAQAGKHLIKEGEVLLTADCIVIMDNIIFEKPKNYEDAFRMIRTFSGNSHEVISGVCLMSHQKERVFSGVSRVYFDELTDKEIEFYIKKYQPYDKAGSYGIQEWIGHCKIKKLEGTYTNVMGLPVNLVYEELKAFRL